MSNYILPLEEVLSKYSPVYPEGSDWKLTEKYILDTPSEVEVVDSIIQEIKTTKAELFNEPIVLSHDDENNSYYIANGTHRVVTAMLLGMDKILVRDHKVIEDEEEYQVYETYLVPSDENHYEDIFDYLGGFLRSWKNKEGIWYEASLVSGSNKGICITWWFDAHVIEEMSLARVTMDVTDRLATLGKSQLIRQITTVFEDVT